MKLPFDKVFILHLAENKERYNHLKNECKRLNIEDQVSIWWTCFKPISNFIGEKIESLKHPYYDYYKQFNKDVYGRVFNCAFEHYNIIKTSYLRGYNNILILEDDFKFINDVYSIEYIFNNLPKDYDILKFYTSFINIINENTIFNINKDNIFFNKIDTYKEYYTSTLCYALSRKGMKTIIDIYEQHLMPSDNIFLEINKNNIDLNIYINRYVCIYPNDSISNILNVRNDLLKMEP